MKKLQGGLQNVPGFSYAAIECGIRYPHRLDLALFFSEDPCNASGVFTTNKVYAAPVSLCKKRVRNTIHAILVNATNANACTGTEGYRNATHLCQEISTLLHIPIESVLMASTGIIGVQLPVTKISNELPSLIKTLSPKMGSKLSRAIMTTDTYPKEVAYSFSTSQGDFTIAGTAKGSGMIAPNMATLLAFLVTDAPLPKKNMDNLFKKAIDKTLNSITIDGDMSTNDTALLLSPRKDFELSSEGDLKAFEEALMATLKDLASLVVQDGEGATKCVTIHVKGALSEKDAKKTAKTIAESLLVKTAIFGGDPNWGRIACAAGYAECEFNMQDLSIYFNTIQVLKNGTPTDFDLKKIENILQEKEFTITIDLGAGNEEWVYLTSDLSYDYVKINAEYST